jgi:hypothetical protein
MKTKILLTVLLAASTLSFAEVREMCTGFLPENDMWIAVDSDEAGGITEAQFNAVIDKASAIYGPIIAARGKTLVVNRLWTNGTVNASAQQSGNNWIVNMYGGLARHVTVSQDAFAMVVCHELGHHLGGAPKYGGAGSLNWASNEGQSDYFASMKCIRKYFADEDNIAALENVQVDPLVMERCTSEQTTAQAQALCARTSIAGKALATLLQQLGRDPLVPNFNTPDPRVVTRTADAHPKAQCRLDTYFNGAVCKVDASVEVSNTDVAAGSCMPATHTLGNRPLCWFAPPAPPAN